MKMFMCVAASALAAAALPASAAVVLDQDNFLTIAQPGYRQVQPIGGVIDRRQAQVVVAGKTGKLARVDLQVGSIQQRNRPENVLYVEVLRGGAGSLPAGSGPGAFSRADIGAVQLPPGRSE